MTPSDSRETPQTQAQRDRASLRARRVGPSEGLSRVPISRTLGSGGGAFRASLHRRAGPFPWAPCRFLLSTHVFLTRPPCPAKF